MLVTEYKVCSRCFLAQSRVLAD